MPWLKFNINHQIRVKLTDQGRQALIDNWSRHQPVGDAYKSLDVVHPGWRTDAWIPMQMWSAMEYFGPITRIGAGGPIETEIEIEVD